jgi:hypothetical protein
LRALAGPKSSRRRGTGSSGSVLKAERPAGPFHKSEFRELCSAQPHLFGRPDRDRAGHPFPARPGLKPQRRTHVTAHQQRSGTSSLFRTGGGSSSLGFGQEEGGVGGQIRQGGSAGLDQVKGGASKLTKKARKQVSRYVDAQKSTVTGQIDTLAKAIRQAGEELGRNEQAQASSWSRRWPPAWKACLGQSMMPT